jgi:hypothetical protein
VTSQRERDGALEAVDRILSGGSDADDVLRAVLQVLFQLYEYVGINFAEGDEMALGPSLGTKEEGTSIFPISFDGSQVAELEIAYPHADDQAFLERVAVLVSPYALVGWDTAGEEWTP